MPDGMSGKGSSRLPSDNEFLNRSPDIILTSLSQIRYCNKSGGRAKELLKVTPGIHRRYTFSMRQSRMTVCVLINGLWPSLYGLRCACRLKSKGFLRVGLKCRGSHCDVANRRPKIRNGENTFNCWSRAEWFSLPDGMSGKGSSRPPSDNEFLNRSPDIILTCLSSYDTVKSGGCTKDTYNSHPWHTRKVYVLYKAPRMAVCDLVNGLWPSLYGP